VAVAVSCSVARVLGSSKAASVSEYGFRAYDRRMNRMGVLVWGFMAHEQTDMSADSAKRRKTTEGCIPVGMLENGDGVFYRAMHP